MKDKRGLLKLGFVKNLKPNEKGQNCISVLSRLVDREIQMENINTFIESDDFEIEYIDKDGNVTDKDFSMGFRFKLPWQDVKGNDVYGHFTKDGSNFSGVTWGGRNLNKISNLKKYGLIVSSSWEKLKTICGKSINESSIEEYIISGIEYYNGAGYTSKDGIPTNEKTGKFVKFSTNIETDKGLIVGWFTKNLKGHFEGISWGTESDFKSAQDLREQFYVGRMVFDSIDECNLFLEKLKEKTIPEPWEYKRKKDKTFKNPILKSYLQFELDRLFYEQEKLNYPDTIVRNEGKDKVLFNTNLIDKFGHDLHNSGNSTLYIKQILY